MKTIRESMNWRYATQKFDDKKIPTKEEIMTLLDSARLSPSWYGLQPWKFILVENKELRQKLREAGYNQPKISEAPYFVVFASKTDYAESDVDAFIKSTAEAQGKSIEDLKDLKDSVMNFVNSRKGTLDKWAMNQTHIAFGVFVASAAIMGIDAGPIGGFDPDKYDEILGLKELGLHSAVTCALGFRSEDDEASNRAKSRFSLDEVLIQR